MHDEPPVVGAADESALRELGERARHRRALRRDEARQQLVREVHRDHAPVAGAVLAVVAPAVGDVPEQHEQPHLDAHELADREIEHHRPRPGDRAAEERGHELGPASRDGSEPAVEDGEPGGLEDLVARLGRERLGGVTLPRGGQVAGADELRRGAVDHAPGAGDEPVEDEQPEMPDPAVAGLGRLPRTALEPHRVGERVDDGVFARRGRHGGRELRVRLQDLDPVTGLNGRSKQRRETPRRNRTRNSPARSPLAVTAMTTSRPGSGAAVRPPPRRGERAGYLPGYGSCAESPPLRVWYWPLWHDGHGGRFFVEPTWSS